MYHKVGQIERVCIYSFITDSLVNLNSKSLIQERYILLMTVSG